MPDGVELLADRWAPRSGAMAALILTVLGRPDYSKDLGKRVRASVDNGH
jgi:hypothetical protein